ncbi:ADP-ribosylglycohydrolase family protein [uncultured Tenacibaculum sp.]|uniref:ADP-ribosylglycohydrolase family protein n=1 Tax=uncultured Tenacibaculum sp. TaxID=174713 RepID=UPI002617F023|nr:ADP-ribosylglycohydrolase family protein [uncultured Tenacibaculum sp.]
MNLYEIVLGIAIGDAYGAGVEFQDRNWIRKHVDFSSFVNVRHKIQVPEEKISVFTENYHDWEYTDDTEMTIGVLKALQSKEKFSEALLVQKWIEEYEKGKLEKGYGRNGHGSMRWYFSGEKTIEEIREFQKGRPNPGNAPAMRSVPLGLIKSDLINQYAEINANATHPNINAILSSQCIARATEFLIQKNGNVKDIIEYCFKTVSLNEEYKTYLRLIENLPDYNDLTNNDFVILCGKQPIEAPYFLSGIHGMPSDSKYTAGCVLYILKQSTDTFDALQKSIDLGGDVDSVASITTGIMAGIYGLESIPNYMIANVEGKNYFKKIAKNLKF